jgi:hypothetical protein
VFVDAIAAADGVRGGSSCRYYARWLLNNPSLNMASPLKVIMSPFVNLLFLDNVQLLLLCYFNCCSCGSSVLPLLLNYLNIGILALHDLRQIRLTEIAYI